MSKNGNEQVQNGSEVGRRGKDVRFCSSANHTNQFYDLPTNITLHIRILTDPIIHTDLQKGSLFSKLYEYKPEIGPFSNRCAILSCSFGAFNSFQS